MIELYLYQESSCGQKETVVKGLPTAGIRTAYARIGDLFAWLCAAGLLGAAAWFLLRLT
jgi:apolipoprotein N-acyltransferase